MEMLDRLKAFFKPKPDGNLEMLKFLLSNDSIRQDFLGFGRAVPPSDEQVVSDVNKVLRYTSESDYQIWAKEAWSHVMACIDLLASSEVPCGPGGFKRPVTQNEIDFHRGRLKQTLTLLSISYKAKAMAEEARRKAQARRIPVGSANGNKT
jgi:hypothetical protein